MHRTLFSINPPSKTLRCEGIENALVILRNKLKEGICITREYAADLPIEAYGSELNQMWTNLIDNAIDAMQGKGELKIKTYCTDEWVVVEITDDGPGIKTRTRITASSVSIRWG